LHLLILENGAWKTQRLHLIHWNENLRIAGKFACISFAEFSRDYSLD
jgi:hypothetical protein